MYFPSKRVRRRTGLALVVFAFVLAMNYPAKWLKPFLPRTIRCAPLTGTLWSGSCAGLSAHGTLVGDVTWSLHGARLLAGQVSGTAFIVQPRASANADFEISFAGTLTLRNVHAQLALEPTVLPQLPASLRGTAQIELVQLRAANGRILEIRGRIEARDLMRLDAGQTALGSYEVRFDSPAQKNGDIGGAVRDLGGPFAFDGILRLTPEPGYVLEGRVAPRSGAPDEIVRELQILGQPDADGRRPISVAGTF